VSGSRSEARLWQAKSKDSITVQARKQLANEKTGPTKQIHKIIVESTNVLDAIVIVSYLGDEN
jgi:hypothetical protein